MLTSLARCLSMSMLSLGAGCLTNSNSSRIADSLWFGLPLYVDVHHLLWTSPHRIDCLEEKESACHHSHSIVQCIGIGLPKNSGNVKSLRPMELICFSLIHCFFEAPGAWQRHFETLKCLDRCLNMHMLSLGAGRLTHSNSSCIANTLWSAFFSGFSAWRGAVIWTIILDLHLLSLIWTSPHRIRCLEEGACHHSHNIVQCIGIGFPEQLAVRIVEMWKVSHQSSWYDSLLFTVSLKFLEHDNTILQHSNVLLDAADASTCPCCHWARAAWHTPTALV